MTQKTTTPGIEKKQKTTTTPSQSNTRPERKNNPGHNRTRKYTPGIKKGTKTTPRAKRHGLKKSNTRWGKQTGKQNDPIPSRRCVYFAPPSPQGPQTKIKIQTGASGSKPKKKRALLTQHNFRQKPTITKRNMPWAKKKHWETKNKNQLRRRKA